MARLFRMLMALACILSGAAVGVLNTQPVVLDLGFAALHGTLGLSVLVALLLGVIVGGAILAIAVVAPLRRQLRIARSPSRKPAKEP